MNLCHHSHDFGIEAEWAFFATSHGKSPCDRIGGTVKRKILRTSLQRPNDNQILTFAAVAEFCDNSIEGITFIVILKEDMIPVRVRLEERYKLGDTISGSRSAHHFTPTSQYSIQAKQLSVDTNIFIDHCFIDMPCPQDETVRLLKKNDYITCIFDGFWWVAVVDTVNEEEKDLTCNFLHPHAPSKQFNWPRSKDDGFVPFN